MKEHKYNNLLKVFLRVKGMTVQRRDIHTHISKVLEKTCKIKPVLSKTSQNSCCKD